MNTALVICALVLASATFGAAAVAAYASLRNGRRLKTPDNDDLTVGEHAEAINADTDSIKERLDDLEAPDA